MKKKKIMIICTNANEAGAPKHVEKIIQELNMWYEFIAVFGHDGPVYNRLGELGIKTYLINFKSKIKPFKDLIAIFKLYKLYRKHKPDLIHCHSAKSGIIGRLVALFTRSKWLYTIHGWGWRGFSQTKRIFIYAIEYLLKFVPKGYYIYVAKVVQSDGENLLKIRPDKAITIYNGVDYINNNTINNLDNRFNILMPARVCSAKDHNTLIAAFEALNDKYSTLILCGEGTNDQNFINKARILAPNSFSNIKFLGEKSDIEKYYLNTDIVVLISKFEALPLTILEAMSYKKAVIATEIGGVPEIIIHKKNGLLVNPGKIDDIISAINFLKQKKNYESICFDAYNTYINKFTSNIMINNLKMLYEKLLLK